METKNPVKSVTFADNIGINVPKLLHNGDAKGTELAFDEKAKLVFVKYSDIPGGTAQRTRRFVVPMSNVVSIELEVK